MQIEVSGRQFIFPSVCACCGAESETTLTVAANKSTGKKKVKSETRTWEFPYCNNCIEHIKAASSAVSWSIFIAIVTVTIIGHFNILLNICIIGIAIGITSKLWMKAQSMCNTNCCCVSASVKFKNWHGTQQVFEIYSTHYALAFMIANKEKLINISPTASKLLESNGHGYLKDKPQIFRRYWH